MGRRPSAICLQMVLAVIAAAFVALVPTQAKGQDGSTTEVCTGPIVSRTPDRVFSANLALDPPLPEGIYDVTLRVENSGDSFNGFETAVADVAGSQVGPTTRPMNARDFPQTATSTVTIDEPLTSVTVSDSLPDIRHVASFEACLTFTAWTCSTLALASSPQTTDVVAGTAPGATYPTDSVLAWEPFDDEDNSFWDLGVAEKGFTFAVGDWVWESYRVLDPATGAVVEFAHSFDVPGLPVRGSISITADNGYEIAMNGTMIGSAQLTTEDGWPGSIPVVPAGADEWKTVEHWDLLDQLVEGENVLSVTGVNFARPVGATINNNPAGVIYEGEIEYCNP